MKVENKMVNNRDWGYRRQRRGDISQWVLSYGWVGETSFVFCYRLE